MAQNRYNGLERGVLLHDGTQTKEQLGFGVQQPRLPGMKYPLPSPERNCSRMFQAQPPCKCHINHRPQRRKWAKGPVMQAVFLGSGPKIGGTGVFIPRTEGAAQFSKKPAYSPVLLPARVVQTLNLNVHELGEHVTIIPDQVKKIAKKNDDQVKKITKKNNVEDDVIYISPDISLPKEWTY